MTFTGKGKAPERDQERQSASESNSQHDSFLNSSVMAKFLAQFDSTQADAMPETYFEVPSSHFLARPNAGASSSSAIADTTRTSTRSSRSRSDTSRQRRERRKTTDHSSSSSVSFVTVQETLHPKSVVLQHVAGNPVLSDGFPTSTSLLSITDDSARDPRPWTAKDDAVHPPPAVFFGGHQARPHMPDTSTLAAADYDIDVRSGFLPPEEPVRRLRGIEEDLWESALDRARALPLRIGGGGVSISDEERRRAYEWRRDIRRMLIAHPSPELAADIRFARRAHLVLSFLAHFYIHSQPAPSDKPTHNVLGGAADDLQDAIDEAHGAFRGVIPASIAVPWVAISRMLDMPPILTYATTVMWNWHLRDPSRGLVEDNVEMSMTFSGTSSEDHFYKSSLLVEMYGVKALTLMRLSLDEAFVGDTLALRRMRRYLRQLSKVVSKLQQLIHDIRTDCDPTTFYWGIRPWFNGCDAYVDEVTGEKGWVYEGVEEYRGERMLFLGPSAGQSSLIHAIDVFLGVDHSAAGTTSAQQQNSTFMERMQVYMPGPHRNFLNHLRSISFVDDDGDAEMYDAPNGEEEADEARDDAAACETHPIRALLRMSEEQRYDFSEKGMAYGEAVERLRMAYNDALTSLKRMRDEHMRIAMLYVVAQMRTLPPPEFATLNKALTSTAKANEDSRVAADADGQGAAKGTGGTDLVSFLRDCRINTVNTLFTDKEGSDGA